MTWPRGCESLWKASVGKSTRTGLRHRQSPRSVANRREPRATRQWCSGQCVLGNRGENNFLGIFGNKYSSSKKDEILSVSFDETREPKMISEAVCLCRRSRGASGAFCLPIKREVTCRALPFPEDSTFTVTALSSCSRIDLQVPVLRRVSCDTETGHWRYERASLSITVGCHSVLPRTQRATALSRHYRNHMNGAV